MAAAAELQAAGGGRASVRRFVETKSTKKVVVVNLSLLMLLSVDVSAVAVAAVMRCWIFLLASLLLLLVLLLQLLMVLFLSLQQQLLLFLSRCVWYSTQHCLAVSTMELPVSLDFNNLTRIAIGSSLAGALLRLPKYKNIPLINSV